MPFAQTNSPPNRQWVYRLLFIIAVTVGIGIPLFEGLYVYPRFLDWLTDSTEDDALRIGRHLAATLSTETALSQEAIPERFRNEVDQVVRDLEIERLKLFSPDGTVIFSTQAGDVGGSNRSPYFHEQVAKGIPYSKVVKKDAQTLEGRVVSRDVVETYVPLLREGVFVGAMEIYYDITAKKSDLQQLREGTLLNIVLVSLGLMLSILVILLLIARFRRDAEKAEQRYQAIVDTFSRTGDGICIIDAEFHPIYMNDVMADQFGARGNLPCYKAIFGLDAPCDECRLPAILQDNETVKYRRAANGCFYDVIAAPIRDRDGTVYSMAVYRNITEQRVAEERLLHQANFDNLTHLPNRQLAEDRLSQALKSAHRNQQKTVLMFIDLDDFKKVNDTLGHDVGDRLLVQAAERLKSAVREDDTVARYGGDEFLIIVGNLDQAMDAEPIAEKVLDAFSHPFEIGSERLIVSTSIGLSVYPDDGEDTVVLLKNADTAMYRAKESGRNAFSFFMPSMNQEIVRRLEIEKRLHGALERGELSLHYQPMVNARTLELVGAEALIRWHNDELGRVPPDDFISLAEQTGLIEPLGEWVLRTAAAQVAVWRREHSERFFMAVNVSPRQFRNAAIKRVVTEVLEQHALPPGALEIEVTEGLLMKARKETRQLLRELYMQGITLSLDDFGTGYSSLQYLQQFPFKVLKIDRSFIHDLHRNEKNRAVVRATIAMARGLGLTVVGEGVETREQLEFLRESGCHLIQGWYIARALPAADFTRLFAASACVDEPTASHGEVG